MKTWVILALTAANSLAYEFCDGSVTMTVAYKIDTQSVEIVTTQPDKSWFGILLGSSSMTNTEAIYFVADGASSSAANYWSTGTGVPTLSDDQTLSDSVTSVTPVIKMTTTRKLDPVKTN